jgi:hypothetical protein
MKQKIWVNVIIVIVSSALLLIVWSRGLDYAYGKMLTFGANTCLVFSPQTKVSLKMVNDAPNFVVKTIVDGKKGQFPQKADLILLPLIMVLTWQILLFFNIDRKKAIRSAIENLVIFYIIQVIYVLLLTGYYKSSTIQFIYDLLIDSFYIIVLFLIVKDTFRYGLIRLTRKEPETGEQA